MATIFLDTFPGSGSVHGHAPDVGTGAWYQDTDAYPPSATAIAGGKASLSGGATVVYVDYTAPIGGDYPAFEAIFEFVGDAGAASSNTEFGAKMAITDGSGAGTVVGGYYYSYTSGFYNPPRFQSFTDKLPNYDGFDSTDVVVAAPIEGATRTLRIAMSNGAQVVELDGVVMLSGDAAMPPGVDVALSFKLLGPHSLQNVLVNATGTPIFWTRHRNTREVA